MSLVDVVIPAFNAKETIGLAIDSVLNQSIDVVRKIIVVDDGSTINREYFNLVKKKVCLLKNSRNKGKGYSIKKAIKKIIVLQDVKGIIIAGKYDEKLYYAQKMLPDIEVFLYEVNFKLNEYKK